VAPWGEVLADAGSSDKGFVTADIDLAACSAAQKRHGTADNRQKLMPVRIIS
jgi:predicted amidohydrolase